MKKKIGEILIAHKVVSAEDIAEALMLQADGDPSRLGEILIQRGRLGADALAKALAAQKALPYTELSLVSSSFAQVVPLSFQHRHWLVPFEEPSPGEFCIAVADPMATDAIERVKNWLNATSIHLYIASSDEIERVLLAIEDQGLASGEILTSSESSKKQPALEPESSQKQAALSEADLFGSLSFEEDEPTVMGGKHSSVTQQQSAPAGLDETTQISRRPGPPAEKPSSRIASLKTARKRSKSKSSENDGRERTPKLGSSEILPHLSPLGVQLTELLVEKGTAELANVVIGLADLLVSKSVLSREEVLDIFASSPPEKW